MCICIIVEPSATTMKMSTSITQSTATVQSAKATDRSTTSIPKTSNFPPRLPLTSIDVQLVSTFPDTLLTSTAANTKYQPTSEISQTTSSLPASKEESSSSVTTSSTKVNTAALSDETQPSDGPLGIAGSNEEANDPVFRGGVSGTIIGGAVVGLFMVLILLVVVGVALTTIWLKHKNKRTALNVKGPSEFSNAVYEEGVHIPWFLHCQGYNTFLVVLGRQLYANVGPAASSDKLFCRTMSIAMQRQVPVKEPFMKR